jgi:hypothetical protein
MTPLKLAALEAELARSGGALTSCARRPATAVALLARPGPAVLTTPALVMVSAEGAEGTGAASGAAAARVAVDTGRGAPKVCPLEVATTVDASLALPPLLPAASLRFPATHGLVVQSGVAWNALDVAVAWLCGDAGSDGRTVNDPLVAALAGCGGAVPEWCQAVLRAQPSTRGGWGAAAGWQCLLTMTVLLDQPRGVGVVDLAAEVCGRDAVAVRSGADAVAAVQAGARWLGRHLLSSAVAAVTVRLRSVPGTPPSDACWWVAPCGRWAAPRPPAGHSSRPLGRRSHVGAPPGGPSSAAALVEVVQRLVDPHRVAGACWAAVVPCGTDRLQAVTYVGSAVTAEDGCVGMPSAAAAQELLLAWSALHTAATAVPTSRVVAAQHARVSGLADAPGCNVHDWVAACLADPADAVPAPCVPAVAHASVSDPPSEDAPRLPAAPRVAPLRLPPPHAAGETTAQLAATPPAPADAEPALPARSSLSSIGAEMGALFAKLGAPALISATALSSATGAPTSRGGMGMRGSLVSAVPGHADAAFSRAVAADTFARVTGGAAAATHTPAVARDGDTTASGAASTPPRSAHAPQPSRAPSGTGPGGSVQVASAAGGGRDGSASHAPLSRVGGQHISGSRATVAAGSQGPGAAVPGAAGRGGPVLATGADAQQPPRSVAASTSTPDAADLRGAPIVADRAGHAQPALVAAVDVPRRAAPVRPLQAPSTALPPRLTDAGAGWPLAPPADAGREPAEEGGHADDGSPDYAASLLRLSHCSADSLDGPPIVLAGSRDSAHPLHLVAGSTSTLVPLGHDASALFSLSPDRSVTSVDLAAGLVSPPPHAPSPITAAHMLLAHLPSRPGTPVVSAALMAITPSPSPPRAVWAHGAHPGCGHPAPSPASDLAVSPPSPAQPNRSPWQRTLPELASLSLAVAAEARALAVEAEAGSSAHTPTRSSAAESTQDGDAPTADESFSPGPSALRSNVLARVRSGLLGRALAESAAHDGNAHTATAPARSAGPAVAVAGSALTTLDVHRIAASTAAAALAAPPRADDDWGSVDDGVAAATVLAAQAPSATPGEGEEEGEGEGGGEAANAADALRRATVRNARDFAAALRSRFPHKPWLARAELPAAALPPKE